MKRIMIIGLLVLACGNSPTMPSVEVSYDVQYYGEVRGSYEIHIVNPENAETIMYWGNAPTWGDDWSSPVFTAHPGDTLRGEGWSSIGVSIVISVDGEAVGSTLCADSVYVEYVLP